MRCMWCLYTSSQPHSQVCLSVSTTVYILSSLVVLQLRYRRSRSLAECGKLFVTVVFFLTTKLNPSLFIRNLTLLCYSLQNLTLLCSIQNLTLLYSLQNLTLLYLLQNLTLLCSLQNSFFFHCCHPFILVYW